MVSKERREEVMRVMTERVWRDVRERECLSYSSHIDKVVGSRYSTTYYMLDSLANPNLRSVRIKTMLVTAESLASWFMVSL